MASERERHTPDDATDGPDADIASLLAEARDMAAYARWALRWLDLPPADRDELHRHVAAFGQLVRDLRAIVRGEHPYGPR